MISLRVHRMTSQVLVCLLFFWCSILCSHFYVCGSVVFLLYLYVLYTFYINILHSLQSQMLVLTPMDHISVLSYFCRAQSGQRNVGAISVTALTSKMYFTTAWIWLNSYLFTASASPYRHCLTASVPSKFFLVCAEENHVWAAHFDVWALQLSYFRKRQMYDGDPDGSAGLLYDCDPHFWLKWNRCVWQPKNKCFLNIWRPFRIPVKFCLHLTGYFLRFILKGRTSEVLLTIDQM